MENLILKDLRELLSPKQVLTGVDLVSRYSHIWTMEQGLTAKAVLLPGTTEELSAIMKLCYDYGQMVTIHGGLTNLVGATETTEEEIVISMERFNTIEEIDTKSRTITTQAGVILENIINLADAHELLFPLNFGAKGSAQIGGVIASNAGGLRVFRYGMTRNLVLGLEAVLADGTIVSSMKKIIKDNSAYDIKQLFIGSEGTLGIITKAVLKLVEKPKSRNAAFIALNDYQKVVDLLKYLDAGLAGTLSGFELIWEDTYEAFTAPEHIVNPLPYGHKYYVLIESLGSDYEKDFNTMQALLEQAFEKELIEDAAMANSASDMELFWRIREDVKVMVAQCQNDQHFDISMPIPLIGEQIEAIKDNLMNIPEVHAAYCFGHVADGNIHVVVGKTVQNPSIIQQVNQVVYSPLKAIGGSVSAEHGIGRHKKSYLSLCRNESEIELMKTLKRSMDTKNILNRGRVIDV